ncbi:ABC transporter, partial [Streptomyces sp. T-3]|nr:ABC transporter [Streptomyces sp. T-3]
DHRVAVPVLPAVGAGVAAALVCALTGAAVGALFTWPVVRRTGWSLVLTALGALLALVVTGSPAQAAVEGLIGGSQTGVVTVPVVGLCGALALAGVVWGLAGGVAARRGS